MSMSELLRTELLRNASEVERALNAIQSLSGETEQVVSCLYSLNSGGKRLRPFLVLQSCAALGGEEKTAMFAACAVEMVHTFSLIHDDLPGMDDDDIRRGQPTLHKICGTEKALFAGDRLLIESFRQLLRTPLSHETVAEMLRRLVQAAGPAFLIGGQFMDMYHPKRADMAWSRKMIRGKTSALIRVSMELGALAAGVSAGKIDRLSNAGEEIGWLFQLTDDILDVTGTAEEMGKAVAKDSHMGKWNPVNELGLAGAKQLALESVASILQDLESLPGDWTVVAELVQYLPERRK